MKACSAIEIAGAFDRFSRGTHRPGRGAGLGLAIVKAIATAHGGDATIATDHPSSVLITLPRRAS